MKRREFIGLIAGAATVWPLAACSEQAAMPLVGNVVPNPIVPQIKAAILRGLAEAGYEVAKMLWSRTTLKTSAESGCFKL